METGVRAIEKLWSLRVGVLVKSIVVVWCGKRDDWNFLQEWVLLSRIGFLFC